MAIPAAQENEDAELCEWRDFGNGLARRFYAEMGYVVPEGYRFDQATHPQERMCWRFAIIACEEYDGTDLEDIVNQIED